MSQPIYGSRRKFIAANAAACFAVGIVHEKARAAQFEFKCGSELERDHPAVVRLNEMWAAIEQESRGRIHTQMFPANVLGDEAAMFTQTRLGALQFLLVNVGALSSVVPAANIVNLGFAFKDPAEGLRALDGPLGEFVRQETAAKGLFQFRTIWSGGMNQIGSTLRPTRVPEDLQGFRIRVPQTKIQVDLFKELGASPSPISLVEVYAGLQTKLIDGEAAPLVVIETTHWYEVEKYLSLTNHVWTGEWLIANGDLWKSLPSDLQAIVERNHTKYALLGRRDIEASQASIVAKLRSQGMVVNVVDQTPFRARLRSYYESWATAFGATEWGLLQSALGRKLT